MRITIVSFEQFGDYQFVPPATFYVMDSMQNYHFIHTSKRATAQEWCDESFGRGRYTVKASKIQKGNGNVTCSGSQTTKGQRK